MNYVDARNTRIPQLGFGTWQLHGKECREAIAAALDIGFRHIDTAQMYGNESDVGMALANTDVDRQDIWLTTKLSSDNMSRDRVAKSTDESLKRLGVDYVDLLLIHWPSKEVPLAETLEAMQQLREKKKIRCLGVSNFPPSSMKEALTIAPIVTNQVEYHPFLSQRGLVADCRRSDIALTAYSPLAKGGVFDDPTLEAIGKRHRKNAAQVTLRWLIQQPKVAAIPKSSNPEHTRKNFDIFDFELSNEEMDQIGTLARDERLIDPEWAPDWNS